MNLRRPRNRATAWGPPQVGASFRGSNPGKTVLFAKFFRGSKPTDNIVQRILWMRGERIIEVVTNCDHLKKVKFSNVLPYAFTEHGAVMAASILTVNAESTIATQRAF